MTTDATQVTVRCGLMLVCCLGWLAPITAGTTSAGLPVTLQRSLVATGLKGASSRMVRTPQSTRSPLVTRLLEEREVTPSTDAPVTGAHDVRLEHSYQQYHVDADPGDEQEIADPSYNYVYEVQGEKGSGDYGHTEMRDGAKTWGRYFVHQPDGRVKTVRYWADHTGYHAEVEYHTVGSQEVGE